MADVEASNSPSLAQDYFVEDKQKSDMAAKPTEESRAKPVKEITAEETVLKTEETPNVVSGESAPAVVEKNSEESNSAAEESKDSSPDEGADTANPASSEEENNDIAVSDNAFNEEDDDTPKIKIETAPADYRFPTTNQTRHCFTRYIEYHRCIAAKGKGAPECDKFAKYYRSLCPSEWVERWNEQRENGTFPGPL